MSTFYVTEKPALPSTSDGLFIGGLDGRDERCVHVSSSQTKHEKWMQGAALRGKPPFL